MTTPTRTSGIAATLGIAHRFVAMVLGVVLGVASAGPSSASGAQPFGKDQGFDFAQQGPPPEGAVTLRVRPDRERVRAGGRLVLAVEFEIYPGWHTWPANEPITIPELEDWKSIPTTLRVTLPEAWSQGRIQWPEVHAIPTSAVTPGKVVKIPMYEGTQTAYVPILVPAGAEAGSATIDLTFSYQACDANMCDRPRDTGASVTLTVAPDAPDDGVTFSGFDPSVFEDPSAWGGSGDAAADATGGASEVAPETFSAPRELLGVRLPAGSGVVLIALAAAVGGFVLNLTPCVLPVIPIKIMAISQHAGEHRARAIVLGLWMALGVLAFWVAIGTPMAFLRGSFDPSRLLFGHWWVTLGLGLVIALLGVGIMGLFTITLPQKVYMVNPKADSAWGSFLFGVMTAVLGLPCFGFVAGGLLAGAATLPPSTIMVVFAGLGAGMAFPYLLLSIFPKLVDRIPRTGPASELVKQVLGLLMLAASAYFVVVAFYTLIIERPWLSTNLKWWVPTVFVGLAALWLTVRILQISKSAPAKIALPVLALGVTLAMGAFSSSSMEKAREAYLAREALGLEGDAYLTDGWNEFTPARFQRARDDGKVVVLDFTAEWCINCKAYKAAVLDTAPVAPRLREEDVVVFEVDVTSSRAPGNALMNELGVTGIPLLAIYGPGVKEPLLSNSAPAGEVLRRISLAAGENAGS